MSNQVTIAIPIFGALEETIRCVESILGSDAKEHKILLLDDASPGGVKCLKQRFDNVDNIEFISHFKNRGYTYNVQYAVDMCTTDHLCILNSDVIVPSEWLKRLVSNLSLKHVAAVGPLSNAASYQSVPKLKDISGVFSKNECFSGDQNQINQMNSILYKFFADQNIDIPILNGFCTLFKVKDIRRVGGFDVNSFPQGYGEENDLCVRLSKIGKRLSVVPGVFVYHEKSKSFGDDRKASLSKRGASRLTELYGSNLVPNLASIMQESKSLAICRLFSELCLLENSLANLNVVTLEGGRAYELTDKSFNKVGTCSIPHISIQHTDKESMILDVPDSKTIKILDSQPLRTALLSVAMESQNSPVFYKLTSAFKEVDAEFLSRIPFDRFFLGE